jgi:hypothetical protein
VPVHALCQRRRYDAIRACHSNRTLKAAQFRTGKSIGNTRDWRKTILALEHFSSEPASQSFASEGEANESTPRNERRITHAPLCAHLRNARFSGSTRRMAAGASRAGNGITLLLITACIGAPLLRRLDLARAFRVRATVRIARGSRVRRRHGRHERRNRIAGRKCFLQRFIERTTFARHARSARLCVFFCRRCGGFPGMRQILAISFRHDWAPRSG